MIRFDCISGSSFPNIKGEQGEGCIRSPILKYNSFAILELQLLSRKLDEVFPLTLTEGAFYHVLFQSGRVLSSVALLPNPFLFEDALWLPLHLLDFEKLDGCSSRKIRRLRTHTEHSYWFLMYHFSLQDPSLFPIGQKARCKA